MGGALNNVRKSGKKIKLTPPPTNNTKITNHFQPNSAGRGLNEPGVNLVRKPREKLWYLVVILLLSLSYLEKVD